MFRLFYNTLSLKDLTSKMEGFISNEITTLHLVTDSVLKQVV